MFKVEKKNKAFFVYENLFDLPENTQWVFVNASEKLCVSFQKNSPILSDCCFAAKDSQVVCEVKLGDSDWKDSLVFVGEQVVFGLEVIPKEYPCQDEDSLYDRGYHDGMNDCIELLKENFTKFLG